ncbi:hypothetical protein PybrP1_007830 [[Pythium] brassicae (nom. inval.)]|nr:hypothetical protein PybrP1_007830 [[Pythium] brassicae (nom. inval.)]
MKHGLVLGLDGVGKTLLLRQLASHLRKRHKGVLERLAAIAGSVSSAAGLSPSSYFGTATDAASRLEEDLIEAPGTEHHQSHARHHHHHHRQHRQRSPPATATVSLETQPTVGVEHTSLPMEARGSVVMCEVGAQLLPMWKAYFASCDFWVFVLDVSNAAQVAGSVIEFFNVLSHDAMRRKPKLLLLNKSDASFALDDALLVSYLQLDRLLAGVDGHLLHVAKVSAATGENLDAVVKWLGQRCAGGGTGSSSGHHGSTSGASSGHVGATATHNDNDNDGTASPSPQQQQHQQEAPPNVARGDTRVHPVTPEQEALT